MVNFQIVVAVCNKRGIGYKNELPWRIPKEIKYFKDLTSITKDPRKRNVVIMGRNTWESIPETHRPLSNRLNIVISKNPSKLMTSSGAPPDHIFSSFKVALKFLEKNHYNLETIFVIGGSTLYQEAITSEYCEAIHYTYIPIDYPCDSFFPAIPWGKWHPISKVQVISDPTFFVCVYVPTKHFVYKNPTFHLPPNTLLMSKDLISQWKQLRLEVQQMHQLWTSNKIPELANTFHLSYEKSIEKLQSFEKEYALDTISKLS